MRPGIKKSIVWNYFEKRQDKTAICSICEKVLKYFGSTTNLMQHLLRIHPIQFQQDKEHPHKFEVKNENILSETTDMPTTVTRNKRKKQISENTEEEEEEVDSVLATVLRAVSSIAETPKKKNKVENFSNYLLSELEAFPPADAEIFMDEVVNSLIKFKQELRERDNVY